MAAAPPCPSLQVQVLLSAAPQAALERLVSRAAGATPLYAACCEGHAGTARQLVAAAPQAAGMLCGVAAQKTPLHAAIQEGHVDVVRLILEAAPHTALIGTSDGHLPIHLVAAADQHASSGHIVQLLLDAAPDTATRAHSGFTPLHFAALKGNAAAARLLDQATPGGDAKALQIAVSSAMTGPAQCRAPNAVQRYLDTACAMLVAVPPDVSLPILLGAGGVALPLCIDVAANWPLTAAQWQQVPRPCPGLGRALPAVVQRSEAEAAALVVHLPPADSARLRAFALALHCAQRFLHIHLPSAVVHRLLSLFDA